METWIKIYEEPIGNSLEEIDVENYKIWLNEMLDDEAIPYKNSIKYDSGFVLNFSDGMFILEVYVHEQQKDDVEKIIEEYNSANSISEELIDEEE